MIRTLVLLLWQLPQSILAFFVYLYLKAKGSFISSMRVAGAVVSFRCVVYHDEEWSVSLGEWVFVRYDAMSVTLNHELGHSAQSRYLGPLYLLVIGLPSVLGNLYDQWFHYEWGYERRVQWYYTRFPESWADRLGGVSDWSRHL